MPLGDWRLWRPSRAGVETTTFGTPPSHSGTRKLQGENVVHQFFLAPDEFLALADMFRNEGPINFNTDGQYFVSAAEQVGENEPQP
jgi:hypothetical protein